MLLQHYLERTAQLTPDATFLIAEDQRLTYGAVDGRANAVARGLVAGGVRPGDRVAIQLDNRVEAILALFGVLKAGAAFVMINSSAKPQKVEYLLRHSEASAFILSGNRLGAFAPAVSAIETLSTLMTVGPVNGASAEKLTMDFEAVAADMAAHPRISTIDLDLAALLYTSGSTGEPKGVMLTHANVRAAIDSIVEYLQVGSADVIMNVLPLSFGYGLTQLFSAAKTGAQFVLEKGMTYPHVTLARMGEHRVTGFAMVPTIASVLLGMDLAKYDLSSLRYVTNAGAGLPTEHARRLREALPHVDLILMYGQTECLRVSYLDPSEVDRRPDSVGRGIPNQQLMIVGEHGSPVTRGEIGELVVRGSHVMRGYWKMPTETAASLKPAGLPGEVALHTGDLFRQDEDGFFYFVARRDDIIKCKGEKVSPREVENALHRLDGVAEAAVVGVPDPLLGQAVKAFVVLRDGAALAVRDIQRHCAASLEDFMVPSIVELCDELPKSDNGKILKTVLRGAAAAPKNTMKTMPANGEVDEQWKR